MAVHKQNIVPDGIRHYIGSLARKALGAALITAAAYMLASLVSYSPSDSSLFTVGTFPTRNWGGASGANAAAFMLQFFGLFPLLFVYDVYLLGRSFIQPAHLKHGARAIFLALVFSAPFACLSLSYASGVFLETFPTETGLGGLLGHIIKSDIASVLDNAGISGAMAAILFVLSTVVWLATMYFTLNLDQDSIIRFESRIARAYHGIANFMRLKIFGKKARQPDARTESKILSMLKIRSPKKRAEARPPAPVQRTPSKSKYRLPPLSLLNAARADNSSGANEELNEKKARMLEATLAEFGVVGRIASIKTGPVITLFEMEPGKGVKTSRITALAEDIARDMSALSARVAVIPGTNKIGIELPNMHRKTVYIREQLESSAFRNSEYSLPISLGKDTGGRPVFVDLAKMPHLLIAGTTGSGKSVGVNAMLLSLLYKFAPDEIKFILIDPKMLEFSIYNGIPHLLIPVVTDPAKAVAALKWAVREMEERNKNMSALGAKNIESYNAKAANMAGKFITREAQTGFNPATGEPVFEERRIEIKPMPYIVVVVDEMADLMLVAGKEVEAAIARLAAMARAAGIHLILSTQRPSVDVITGTIKSNFPNRIAYRVASKIDSRTIINEQGAELMLGKGDMLYMAMGGNLIRIHGAYVTEEEVERVAAHLKSEAKPNYVKAVTAEKPSGDSPLSLLDKMSAKSAEDDLYRQAVQIILSSDRPSISYLQRQLGIGYNKSANLIERMQEAGILSAPDSTGKRTILAQKH